MINYFIRSVIFACAIFVAVSGPIYASSLLHVDEAKGRLGIGTETPKSTLDVDGTVTAKRIEVTPDGLYGKYAGQYEYASITESGWYRIAKTVESKGNRANATFILQDRSSKFFHSTVTFKAGIAGARLENAAVTVLNHNFYDYPLFRKARIIYRTSDDDMYLEVYIDAIEDDYLELVSMSIQDNLQYDGWHPIDFEPGNIPSGYAVEEYSLEHSFAAYQNGLSAYFSNSVGIGTSDPNYALAVKGTIKADQIWVPIDWADYVFADDYKLRPLDEVETFISNHRHLPGVPSEADIKETGIDIATMQQLLLEKIEELTLYTIKQKNEINTLKGKLDRVNDRLHNLETNKNQ